MNRQETDEKIKAMFREEAEKLEAPESMKQQIDERILQTGSGRKPGKKKVLVLVAAVVLLFGSMIGQATVKPTTIRGWTSTEPDSRNYDDLQKIAEDAGYFFQGVKEFSNGYSFRDVTKGFKQEYDGDGQPIGEVFYDLHLVYTKDITALRLALDYVRGDETVSKKNLIKELEWNGVRVYESRYIYFELPSNWEELISEEEKKLIEDGLATGGVDDYNKEIIKHTVYSLQWQQGDIWYHLSAAGLDCSEQIVEDMEVIAREWIEAN